MQATRRVFPAVSVVIGALAMNGCIEMASAIHAVFPESDASVEAAVAGQWVAADGSDRLVFERGGGRELRVYEGDDQARYAVRFGRLGEHAFMDMIAAESPKTLALPVHLIARIRVEDGRLELAFLSSDWLKGALADSRVVAAHEETEYGILLTAPTSDLQRILADWGHDDTAFEETSVYVRPAGAADVARSGS